MTKAQEGATEAHRISEPPVSAYTRQFIHPMCCF